ncbi:hypothetical protein Trydic_g19840 [Trypoxylus dichotomus]
MELSNSSFNDDREDEDFNNFNRPPPPTERGKYLKVVSPSNSEFLLEDSKDLRDIILAKKSRSAPIRKHSSSIDIINRKRRLSFDDYMVPRYKNYQLLGDSQCVRYAEQMLGMHACTSLTTGTKSRYIGYCVSGQKIQDLEHRLSNRNYEVHSKVIMMIGTNDLIQRTDVQRMCETYKVLLNRLTKRCSKIVLVTVPPVPKLEKDLKHWETLRYFNLFIQSKVDNSKIFAIDLCTLFIGYNNSVAHDYFERTFYPGNRLDLIHLNLKGFKMMKAALDTHYFDEEYGGF